MITESYKKEQDRLEKEEAKKAGTPEEPEDTLTVKEILNDREKNVLLGDLVEHDGNPEDTEALTRLVSGKMETGDLDRISRFRGALSEKLRDAEAIKADLTPEMVKELAASNPDIEKIVGYAGADGAVKAVHETIKRIAVTDPDRFQKIVKNVETRKSFENGELKKLDDDVKELCKKENMNADEFAKVLAIKDAGEQEKAMKKLLRDSWGKGSFSQKADKFMDTITFKIGSGSTAVELLKQKGKIDDALAEIAKQKKELGSILAASFLDNKDLLEALSRETVGAPKKKESVSMAEAKKFVPTEESLKKSLPEEFKEYRKNIANWDTLPESGKDDWREKFLKKKKAEGDKNFGGLSGLWAMIFGALFNELFAGFDKKSLN